MQAIYKRSGFVYEEMSVAPVTNNDALFGMLQVINSRSNQPLNKFEEGGAQQFCSTLGITIRQRMQRLGDRQRKKTTEYDDLVADG